MFANRRNGTSLIETVMVIPLLAVVIVSMFFMGYAMSRKQWVTQAGRYVAWYELRQHNLPQQYRDARHGGSLGPSGPMDDELNASFYYNNAASTSIGQGGPTPETITDYVQAVSSYSGDAGDIADNSLLTEPHWPHGRHAAVSTVFNSDVSAFRRYQGDIRSRHRREGVQWSCNQIDSNRAVAGTFLVELDDALMNVQAEGQSLASILRGLYMSRWYGHRR